MTTREWMVSGLLYGALFAVLLCTTREANERETKTAADRAVAAKTEKEQANAAEKAVAKRPIPKGGLVSPAALDRATAADLKALAGTYARRDLRSGDKVRVRDVQAGPILAAGPGVLWLGLPVARAEAESGRIEAGAAGAICTARGLVAEAAVGAVSCPDPKGAYCIAYLRVGAANLAAAQGWLQLGVEVAPRCR
jgi:hypothetical protein